MEDGPASGWNTRPPDRQIWNLQHFPTLVGMNDPHRKKDLLAPPAVLLPEESLTPASTPQELAVSNPASPRVWAELAELALENHDDPTVVYAYARTGYHRGLDMLRKNGWKGFGPLPYSHEPNRGVLRAIAALAKAAKLIGEAEEYDRLIVMLEDADATAVDTLMAD